MSGLRGRERRAKPIRGEGAPEDLIAQSPEKFHTLIAASRHLDRVASSPCLANFNSPFVQESERTSSRGSLDTYLLEDTQPVNFDALNAAVTDILNDLVNALVDAKTRQMSATLTKFYNTITTRDIFRRVILDSLDWQIESCLSALVPILVRLASLYGWEGPSSFRSKGSRAGGVSVDAVKAFRCTLFVLICLQRVHIETSVSGTLLESIVQACLNIVPKVSIAGEAIGNEKQHGGGSSPYVVWLAYSLIGELIRTELAADCLPQDFADLMRHTVNGSTKPSIQSRPGIPPSNSHAANAQATYAQATQSVSWREWLQSQTHRWVRRKKAQQKQALSLGTFPTWTNDDIADLDGLCMCLSSWIFMQPASILHNRSSATSPFSFIWKFIDALSEILSVNTVEIVNMYVGGMPSDVLKPKGSLVVLGLALFLGQVFESWWQMQMTAPESSTTNPVGGRLLGSNAPFQLHESDRKLIRALEVFGGKPATADSNKLSRNLSKDVAKTFREVCSTIECGEPPSTTAINIKLADVADGVSQAVTTENPMATGLIGEIMEISSWRQSHVLRLCREFCGNHSSLVCALQMELAGEEVFTGGTLSQDRKARDRQFAASKKLQKQERQFLHSAKEAARGGDFYDEE